MVIAIEQAFSSTLALIIFDLAHDSQYNSLMDFAPVSAPDGNLTSQAHNFCLWLS